MSSRAAACSPRDLKQRDFLKFWAERRSRESREGCFVHKGVARCRTRALRVQVCQIVLARAPARELAPYRESREGSSAREGVADCASHARVSIAFRARPRVSGPHIASRARDR